MDLVQMPDQIRICADCFGTNVQPCNGRSNWYCDDCDEYVRCARLHYDELRAYRTWREHAIERFRENGVLTDRLGWINQQLVKEWQGATVGARN